MAEGRRVVYVRHQEKEWDNGYKGEYRLDAPLTEDGLKRWKEQILELEEKYGIPTLIVTSPFFRCRQMAEQLMELYRDTPVEVDSLCGEYLGHQKLKYINNELLRDDTLIYPIIYKEKMSEFKKRAIDVRNKYSKYRGYTLVLTHGFLMYVIGDREFKYGETLIVES